MKTVLFKCIKKYIYLTVVCYSYSGILLCTLYVYFLSFSYLYIYGTIKFPFYKAFFMTKLL